MARIKIATLIVIFVISFGAIPAAAWQFKPVSAGVALSNGADVDLESGRDLRSLGMALGCQWRVLDFDAWNIDFRAEFQMNGWYNETVGMETIVAAIARANMPLGKFTPYAEAGTGPALEAVNLPEQGTWFNFYNFVGLGLDFDLGEGSLVELGVRLRHISNAGLDERNNGINTIQVHLGYSVDWSELVSGTK